MGAGNRIAIPRTHRVDWPSATFAHALDSDEEVTLTAWLRPKRGGDLDAARARTLGATQLLDRTYEDRSTLLRESGSDEADVAAFGAYCERYGVKLLEQHWRSSLVSGPVDRLREAFGATVAIFSAADGTHFRHRSGDLSVDEDVAPLVQAIFGLHQWPKSRRIGALQRHATPLTAKDVASRYAFPESDGTGQTIGLLQMRGEFRSGDFDQCMKAQNLSPARPILKRVDDAALTHEMETTKDLEAALDSQIIASLAPGARIVIYEAPDDERGFLDAIRTAIFDTEQRPTVLSISYGWPEYLWTPAALDILDDLFIAAALLGVSVFCSSGDNGAELDYDGKPHVLAPASSHFAHACGATVLDAATPDCGESAWGNSGGGFSERFDAPPWQASAADIAAKLGVTAGRGVPDVAAQTQPGYYVVLNGVELAAGGTSAIAPLWSSLTARLNQRLGKPAGFFAPLLYEHQAQSFRNVVNGSNGYYQAGAGWNPCTGLGVPIGTAVESALRGAGG